MSQQREQLVLAEKLFGMDITGYPDLVQVCVGSACMSTGHAADVGTRCLTAQEFISACVNTTGAISIGHLFLLVHLLPCVQPCAQPCLHAAACTTAAVVSALKFTSV